MKLVDLQRRPTVCLLGESGSGKTHQLGTLCQLLPTVVLASDLDGLDTLVKMQAAPVDIIHVHNWTAAWDYLGVVRNDLQNGARAVAVDDLGATQETMRRKAMMMPRGRDEERMSKPAREEYLRRVFLAGDRRLQFQGFQELAESARDFIWELRELPTQFLMVSMLQGIRPHPRTGEEHMTPELEGSVRNTILARFSLVVELFTEWRQGQQHWCATSRRHPRTAAKDRVGEPRTWVSPTASKLLLHIVGKEGPNDVETDLEKQIGTGLHV